MSSFLWSILFLHKGTTNLRRGFFPHETSGKLRRLIWGTHAALASPTHSGPSSVPWPPAPRGTHQVPQHSLLRKQDGGRNARERCLRVYLDTTICPCEVRTVRRKSQMKRENLQSRKLPQICGLALNALHLLCKFP